MNRARSPFFFVALLLFVCLATGVAIYFETFPGPAFWKNPESIARVQQFSYGLMGASGFGLIVVLAMELAIRSGWEPKWLRVRYVGAVVLLKEPDPDDHSRGWITVALPDKSMERYHADPSEFNRVEETQVVMIEVIGQYVAEIRRMTGASAEALEQEAAQPSNRTGVRRNASLIRPESASFGTWITVMLFPMVGGLFLGNGLLAIVMKSADYSYRRRYSYSRQYVYAGDLAVWYGVGLTFLGLVLVGIAIVMWYRGWNPSDFTDDDDWQDYRPRGCRPF